jgi:hypothetical protein
VTFGSAVCAAFGSVVSVFLMKSVAGNRASPAASAAAKCPFSAEAGQTKNNAAKATMRTSMTTPQRGQALCALFPDLVQLSRKAGAAAARLSPALAAMNLRYCEKQSVTPRTTILTK